MKRTVPTALAVSIAGVLTVGGVTTGMAVASAETPATATALSSKQGPGSSSQKSSGKRANQQSNGANASQSTDSIGQINDAERTELLYMVEEEKLAHDVYATLADQYPDVRQFANIAKAETQHQSAVSTLLKQVGTADPTAGADVGEFTNVELQQLYDDLIASATDERAAVAVGVAIEERDIADLKSALEATDNAAIEKVLTNLLEGSQRHLEAFNRA